jgi:lipopolysaccharide/colanic/teichoic acid biosynthesis glycosyltransferase
VPSVRWKAGSGVPSAIEPRFRAALRLGAHAPLRIKRALDITMGVAVGVVTLPAMLLIAAAICLDSPGPALFRAKRIGRHGKLFSMYKFRTMVHGAEERLQEFAHLNLANGMVKIPDDPRVTRIGRWLRRFSLDELPQVYNIVVGHMSLVGPRPHDVDDLSSNDLEHDPRLRMRPGLTGLWQVSARSDPNLESRVRFDLAYVNRWSLLLDARILAKTIPVVILGQGGKVRHEGQVVTSPAGEVTRATESNGSNGSAHPDLLGNEAPRPIEAWALPVQTE